jgi:hypothetical protein
MVNIKIACSDSEWTAVKSRIRETMNQYAFAYSLERQGASEARRQKAER